MPEPDTTKPCRWPDCLTEEMKTELAAQVLTVERGDRRPAMPDQRAVCGCDEQTTTPAPAGPAETIATGNPAYDAVYAHIRSLGDQMPPSPAHRNASIWRAVEAALRAERAAIQRRLIAAFQTAPDPGADETWTRGHRAGLTTAIDALHATTEGMDSASYLRDGGQG